MAMDTPATIAIIGAGPIGIEAALYARFLGYQVRVLERGNVAEHVRRWGHVKLFSPFHMNSSSLGLAALAAQSASYRAPDPDRLLTGRQWVEQYLLPLAQTDLVSDCVQERTEVVSIARPPWLKPEGVNDPRRGAAPFQLLVQSLPEPEGSAAAAPPESRVREADSPCESWVTADIVIDASGVLRSPNWLGAGGGPALGERLLRGGGRLATVVPDIQGADRARFANRHTLVVGAGYSAATAIVELAELAREAPETRVTWVVRRTGEAPLTRFENDRLPERDRIGEQANAAASGPAVSLRTRHQVVSVTPADDGQLRVALAVFPELATPSSAATRDAATTASLPGSEPESGEPEGSELVEDELEQDELDDNLEDDDNFELDDNLELDDEFEEDELDDSASPRTAPPEATVEFLVDEVLSLVGYRADLSLAAELQMHWCYASDGPMRLAARLQEAPGGDCLAAPGVGVDALRNPEPHFYVLGAKSYGRNSQFLYATGLRQIRDLFALIGGRAELDLYASARPLPQ